MRTLGRFNLLERIASGHSSEIYLARVDERTPGAPSPQAKDFTPLASPPCALRLLDSRLADHERFTSMLMREAPAALRFHHPNAVDVLEIAQTERDLFIAMDLAKGQPLSEVMDRAREEDFRIPRELVIWIGAQVASAVKTAHDSAWCDDAGEGMFHGSICPQNVMLTYDGEVKLLGIGIGRSRALITPSPEKLPYRAPEVLAENEITPLSDIYALGVLLYDVFTSEQVFWRASTSEIESAILKNRFERLRTRIPSMSEVVDTLVSEMMSRSPASRPQAAEDVERTLRSQLRKQDDALTGKLAEYMAHAFSGEIEAMKALLEAASNRSPKGSARDRSGERAIEEAPSEGRPGNEDEIDTADIDLGNQDRARRAPDLIQPRDLMADGNIPSGKSETIRSGTHGRTGAGKLSPSSRRPKARPAAVPRDRPTSSASGAANIAGAPRRLRASSPQRVSRFDVLSELGPVGASSAYEARSPEGGLVFLKILDEQKIDDARLRADQWIALFEREAELAGRITVSGVSRLIEHGREASFRYLAYERVDGLSLSALIGREKLPTPDSVRRLASSIAGSLRELHQRGILYCNVHSQAVLMRPDGLAHLSDLSMIAEIEGPKHPLLASNTFALSPEFLRGEKYTALSDQFAFGALLYELLTGTRPFRNLDDRMILQAIRDKDPLPPQTIDSRVDPVLSEVTMRMLEKEPGKRFPSCDDVTRELSL